jgi:hypothetical protein
MSIHKELMEGGKALRGIIEGKVLYDNNWYRSESKVAEFSRNFRNARIKGFAQMFAVIVVFAVFIQFIIPFEWTESFIEFLAPVDWEETTPIFWIYLLGFIFGVFAIMTLVETYFHFKERNWPLLVTERGITFGPKRKSYDFDDIAQISFGRNCITVRLKSGIISPKDEYLSPHCIWDIDRFREAVSGLCQVETEEIGDKGEEE